MSHRPPPFQRWVIRVVGSCILIGIFVMLCGVVGCSLDKPYRATSVARFSQPPQQVFKNLADFPNRLTWLDELSRIESAPAVDGRPVWIHYGEDGAFAVEVVEEQAPTLLITRVEDESKGLQRTRTWTLLPSGDGTTVRVTDEGQLHGAFLRFRKRIVQGVDGDQRTLLTNLARYYGEEVTIQRVE